jgi:hypothetical protein
MFGYATVAESATKERVTLLGSIAVAPPEPSTAAIPPRTDARRDRRQ